MDSQVNTESQFREETPSNDIIASINDWFRYYLKKWWLIGLVGLLGGCIGIWIAYKDVPQYESHLTFALDDGGNDPGGVSGIAAEFGFNISGSGRGFFSGDNIVEIMKSRRIVKTVLLSTDTINGKSARMIQHFLDLTQKKGIPGVKYVNFPVELDRNAFSYLQDSILYNVADKFSTTYIQAKRPDKKLDIYAINVTSPDEHFTKVFTDRIVQETINFYTELKSKKSKATLEILEQRVASMKGSINSSITDKYTIQDANMNPAFASSQVPLQKQNVKIQVYSEAYGEMFKNLELARFQYLKEIPLLQIIDAAEYPMKRIKKGKFATGMIYAIVSGILIIVILTISRFVFLIRKMRKKTTV